jgi:hypothetical protein
MFFLSMLLKKHVRSTCYKNNIYFLYAKGHMSILYVNCIEFSINQLICKIQNFLQTNLSEIYVMYEMSVKTSIKSQTRSFYRKV